MAQDTRIPKWDGFNLRVWALNLMVEEDLEKWWNARLDSHEVSVTGWRCDAHALAYAMIVAVFLNRNGHPDELIAPTKQLCEALESSDWTAATVYRKDLSLLLRDRQGCFDPASHSAFDVVMHLLVEINRCLDVKLREGVSEAPSA